MRIVALALALQALALCRPTPAPAAQAAKGERERIAVVRFLGPEAAMMRAAAVEALVDAGAVDLPPIEAVESQLSARASVWAHASELGQRLEAKVVLHGQTRRVGKRWHVTITVLSGADGGELGQLHFVARSLRRLHAQLHAELWPRLRPLLRRAPVAPAPRLSAPTPPPPLADEAPEAEPPPPPSEAVPPPLPPAPVGQLRRPAPPRGSPGPERQAGDCPILELELGGGVLLRAFDYRHEEQGPLRGYLLRRAPIGQVEATWFPFGGSCGAVGAIGVRVGYGRMASINSLQADRSLSTTAFVYHAELVGRITRGRWAFTPGVGYHARYYAVAENAVVRVNQHAASASLEARWRLEPLILELGAEVRRLFDLGPLASAEWFPGATGVTAAGRVRVGGALTDWLDLMLGVSLDYTWLDFHLQEGGSYPNGRAAGAFDGYLTGLISLRLHLPGTRAP